MAFPESGVKLVADTSEFTSALEEAIGLAEQVDALGDLTIEVSAELDTSGVDVSDLPLDGETIELAIETTVEGDPLPFEGNMEPKIEAEVNATETEEAKETLGALTTLKNLAIIETIWNIAGTAVDMLGNIKSFAVDPLLSLEEAVAKVNAQTNFAIPNADKLINDIFYNDLGNSIGQVGEMVTAAAQLKVPVEEAVTAALAFTKVFDDQNPIDVLNTLNQMVTTGLAPNFTEAGDLLVTAFQNGANKGGDLLTAINNNAVAIKDLGLTGPESLSFISTGLDAGFKSAQSIVDVLVKIKQNVANAAGNEDSDVSKTLDILGISNPAETGEAWSADFFTSVIDAIKNAPGLTDTEREQLFTNLAGGKQGAKTFSSFLEISPEQASTIFANVEGAAVDAGIAIDDSLRGAIDDFMLAAQEAATAFLSSESIDLPGKIAALKGGIQDALNTLAEGGTLGEALTVALKPIGFDDEFAGLESMLGNFVIALLQVVATIQSVSGNFDAKKGTDIEIARLSTQQLAFDLTVGNADEIASEIQVAISRGVTPGTIAETISGTVDKLISDGALVQAQAMVDALNVASQPDPAELAITRGTALGLPVKLEPDVTPEAVAALQDKINEAIAATPLGENSVDELIANDFGLKLDAAKTSTEGLTTAATDATQPVTDLTTKVTEQAAAATPASAAVDALTTATEDQTTAASAGVTPVADMAGSLDLVALSAPAAAAGLSAVDAALRIIIATAGTLAAANATAAANNAAAATAVPGKASGGMASGTFMAGERGPEFISTNTDVAVLNNQTTEAIIAALQGFIPGGSYNGRGGGNSINMVNNTVVPSVAAADALGYRLAAQLRQVATS